MLTVKHIEVTGHETIYAATRVSYQPRRRADGRPYDALDASAASDDIAPCIFIDTPKGDTVGLGGFGMFYVMNDAGKTVAKYDLGGWCSPAAGVVGGAEPVTWTASTAANPAKSVVG
ncbi:MAG: hypothetical protein WC807_18675 [Hyphomicrobium sp.]